MYNNHLVDLYKIAGHYVLDELKKRGPSRKRRGRRRKLDMQNGEGDEPLLLEGADSADEDFDDDFDEADDDSLPPDEDEE